MNNSVWWYKWLALVIWVNICLLTLLATCTADTALPVSSTAVAGELQTSSLWSRIIQHSTTLIAQESRSSEQCSSGTLTEQLVSVAARAQPTSFKIQSPRRASYSAAAASPPASRFASHLHQSSISPFKGRGGPHLEVWGSDSGALHLSLQRPQSESYLRQLFTLISTLN